MNIRRAGPAALLAGVIAASMQAGPVLADDSADRAAMFGCVGQHFTAADAGTMTSLSILVILDAQSNSDLRASLTDKRESIIADAAKLMTRLVEQDCTPQISAVVSSSPPGVVMGALIQELTVLSQRSLQGEDAKRAGVVLALDLVKKLDSKVALDLFGTRATPPASTATIPKTGNATPAATL
jgi:hypothetical protein